MRIFHNFSMKTYVVTTHKNRLDETVLMRGNDICFNSECGKLSQKYTCNSFISGALASPVPSLHLDVVV